MCAKVLLVRHTEVARAWRGRCYGQSDMGLSRAGAAQVRALAPDLARWKPDIVLHSGLRRAQRLAQAIAALSGLDASADPAWQERDFGSWEGRSWSAIYRETGDAMDGMIDDPARFRPGGGETTMELAARSLAAWRELPRQRGLVVTHGGPIAAIAGTLNGVPVREWPRLVPAPGDAVEIAIPDDGHCGYCS
ncbi:alpha-ribazole phosphatase family protein [Sphingomonas ursincola]|jgi:broad specificity phosphatase PhoE|uniref:Histidine phosphatase family protein n=1 Tax=Sphingomonas ursincola TaxID=56361 RepID=A0A7V8U936_9SPHN|nr:histidine phosphatase family protein [Sphingomonas ursincola]MBA1375052.1 histidine phosphatase family protein [Sphingomonas ursincola]MBA4780360.1 histidine phosphatase family protein [Blastomonas sp.]OHD02623.1 MAG: phosphoglycerate mutase [Sphingopyxis sp. RIFCSPHIGHO2_01_FULL_65_24]